QCPSFGGRTRAKRQYPARLEGKASERDPMTRHPFIIRCRDYVLLLSFIAVSLSAVSCGKKEDASPVPEQSPASKDEALSQILKESSKVTRVHRLATWAQSQNISGLAAAFKLAEGENEELAGE